MKIILEGIPEQASSEDINEFLSSYVEVEEITTYARRSGGLITVWVSVVATPVQAQWAVKRLNGRYWREHTIHAYLSLFSDNQ